MDKEYKYMVATRCMTYNHAPYIEDALRGFAMQETTFPVVYIVIDDASTDGEPEVLRKWVAENLEFEDGTGAWKDMPYGQLSVAPLKGKPLSLFVILLLNENHYSIRKSKMLYIAEWNENAKYIALCEGDDYWINPGKLQMQVDYMEEHDDCALTHTRFNYYEDGVASMYNEDDKAQFILEINREDAVLRPYILDGNRYLIQTMTVVMRHKAYLQAMEDLKEYSGKFMMGDTQLWVAILSYGKIHFIPIITANYRLCRNSSTHQTTPSKKLKFELSCSDMRLEMAEKYQLDESIKKKFHSQYKYVLMEYLWYGGKYNPVADIKFSMTEKIFLWINSMPVFRHLARWAHRSKRIKKLIAVVVPPPPFRS